MDSGAVYVSSCAAAAKVRYSRELMFGALELAPAFNPAVLDTSTWDTDKAWEIIGAVALNMTVSGVVAHQSALKNGELLKIPQYKL